MLTWHPSSSIADKHVLAFEMSVATVWAGLLLCAAFVGCNISALTCCAAPLTGSNDQGTANTGVQAVFCVLITWKLQCTDLVATMRSPQTRQQGKHLQLDAAYLQATSQPPVVHTISDTGEALLIHEDVLSTVEAVRDAATWSVTAAKKLGKHCNLLLLHFAHEHVRAKARVCCCIMLTVVSCHVLTGSYVTCIAPIPSCKRSAARSAMISHTMPLLTLSPMLKVILGRLSCTHELPRHK